VPREQTIGAPTANAIPAATSNDHRTRDGEEFEARYRVLGSRDHRFDGCFFVAVTSTGIYCRPSCPAIVPKRRNVRFYPTAAAAQTAGFRACLRCHPHAAPGSPEWNRRGDLAARAMGLIADGVVDREGVAGLAGRLAYSERHLTRQLTAELGAGPLALARAQRAQTARILIETTSLRLIDVAHAAGFASVRQFNDTIRAVYGRTPTELRRKAAPRNGSRAARGGGPPLAATRILAEGQCPPASVRPAARPARPPADPRSAHTALRRSTANARPAQPRRGRSPSQSPPTVQNGDRSATLADGLPIVVRLAYREPLDWGRLVGFLGLRAVPGVEEVVGDCYRRTLRLPRGYGVVALAPAGGHVECRLRLSDLRDLTAAVQRCRRLLDLDADPSAPAEHLRGDRLLAPLVRAAPGLRLPGTVDGAELAVRAVLGQQVSVRAARTAAARLTLALGEPLPVGEGTLTHLFPTPAALAAAGPAALPAGPLRRRSTLLALARLLAEGELAIDPGSDREALRARLLELPGIGPWTADYIALRALCDPDAFLPTDLGVRRALQLLGRRDPALRGGCTPRAAARLAERWRPWRAYALLHLWSSLAES
jgi:AraC family transcriptional regulator, regulatory protein of adaptative response / DNA-3-methyladenine glycosylase II